MSSKTANNKIVINFIGIIFFLEKNYKQSNIIKREQK
jgi:hypothetical protein